MRTREIVCEYQPYIFEKPGQAKQLWDNACSNDQQTVNVWRDTWINNVRRNHKNFGSFKEYGIGNLFGKYRYMPIICAGSGPSLKFNAEQLKDRGGIPLVSCLHNFHYFEDMGCAADYYVSLDAGPVTIEEVSEGGEHDEDYYWELTKDRTLIAFIGSDPKLLEKWQGKIYLYNAMIPDTAYHDALNEIEPFHQWVGNGGNVLGACMYVAKGYFGASTIVFVGADFSFGYDRKFHSWDSKYDKNMGRCVSAFDVFGNKVPTWQSYKNFKDWFDYVSINVPGQYINCTEGGCLGAYADGNLVNIKQMDLKDCLEMFNMCDHLKEQATNPDVEGDEAKKVLF